MRLTVSICVLSLLAGGCGDSGKARPEAKAAARPSAPGTAFITGSSRGLGLEFARQYAAAGWKVIATARKPQSADDLRALAGEHEGVVIEKLDVTSQADIDALAKKYEGSPIDVLINNAGVRGDLDAQLLGKLSYDAFQKIMAVNVYGPLAVSEAFFENVAASEHKKIVVITSGSGSLTKARNKGRGLYFYRISKAGANMAMLTLRGDGHPRGIAVGTISPGPAVNTRMFRQDGAPPPPLEPEESVAGMIEQIDHLTLENAGTFVQYDGVELPW